MVFQLCGIKDLIKLGFKKTSLAEGGAMLYGAHMARMTSWTRFLQCHAHKSGCFLLQLLQNPFSFHHSVVFLLPVLIFGRVSSLGDLTLQPG